MTWLSSIISVGGAAGSAIVGHIIDAGGARWGYVFAAGCGALAVAVCLAGLRRLRTDARRNRQNELMDRQSHGQAEPVSGQRR